MFVVIRYYEGEANVIGPFADEDAAYAYLGRRTSFDNPDDRGRFVIREVKQPSSRV